jgi:hypothetical protein
LTCYSDDEMTQQARLIKELKNRQVFKHSLAMCY